jgi:hypothetical protein
MKDKEKEEDKEENDLVESIGIKATYYNDFVERYFTKYYFNKGKENEQYIFIHSNGIILSGIGKNNIITKVKINEIIDLKKPGKITGRRKHGAHFLSENEYVIKIIYDNEKSYNFCPMIKGKLLEVNQNIINDNNLLINSPESFGFICIILVEGKFLEQLKEKIEKFE